MNLIDLFKSVIEIILMLLAVLILPSLFVGLLVSVFQAATQINEQTLSFVPRLLVTFLTILYASPWIIQKMTEFTHSLFANMVYWIN